MMSNLSRRHAIATAAAAVASAAVAAEAAPSNKTYRIGVISANIRGKSQTRNGHTWHFAQYLHPTIDLDVFCKLVDPGSAEFFRKYVRNPKYTFDQLPFPDTQITHYYDSDVEAATKFCEAFPGVQVARNVEELVGQVDAVWLGDASGYGEDHFDLVAPALRKGLPTFCDKPIGGTVAGTQRILELAREHHAPIMSSSLFRHEFGMEAALRKRDSQEFGNIQFVVASVQGGYTPDGWMIYGQHPAWTVMTLLGLGVEAVSMYARGTTCHALVTYPDRMPAEIWFGRPNEKWEYCHTAVHFEKKRFEFTASIEDDFWYGHHYEMFRLAATFREMVKTRIEPIPHQEILEVTAIVHAAARSVKEQSRLVNLAEVT